MNSVYSNLWVARWQRRGELVILLGVCWYVVWGLALFSVGLENVTDLPLIEVREGFAWMILSGNFFFLVGGLIWIFAEIEKRR